MALLKFGFFSSQSIDSTHVVCDKNSSFEMWIKQEYKMQAQTQTHTTTYRHTGPLLLFATHKPFMIIITTKKGRKKERKNEIYYFWSALENTWNCYILFSFEIQIYWNDSDNFIRYTHDFLLADLSAESRDCKHSFDAYIIKNKLEWRNVIDSFIMPMLWQSSERVTHSIYFRIFDFGLGIFSAFDWN